MNQLVFSDNMMWVLHVPTHLELRNLSTSSLLTARSLQSGMLDGDIIWNVQKTKIQRHFIEQIKRNPQTVFGSH